MSSHDDLSFERVLTFIIAEYKIDPITVVDQTSRNAYYEPEFVAVAKQYKELVKGGDQKALQQFIDERKADTIRRFNVSLVMGGCSWHVPHAPFIVQSCHWGMGEGAIGRAVQGKGGSSTGARCRVSLPSRLGY